MPSLAVPVQGGDWDGGSLPPGVHHCASTLGASLQMQRVLAAGGLSRPRSCPLEGPSSHAALNSALPAFGVRRDSAWGVQSYWRGETEGWGFGAVGAGTDCGVMAT